MAFNKAADREGAPMKRRPMHRSCQSGSVSRQRWRTNEETPNA